MAALRAAANKLDYVDGKTTAGRYARDVKLNLQAKPSKALDALFEKVRGSLNSHEVFQAGARPRKFARMLLSRYRSGMEYRTCVPKTVDIGEKVGPPDVVV